MNEEEINKLVNGVDTKRFDDQFGQHLVRDFFEELVQINDDESWDSKYGQAFEYICAKYLLGIEEAEITDVMIGGSGDNGIDLFYIDKNNNKIIILQAKFGADLNHRISKDSIASFGSVLERLEGEMKGNDGFMHAKEQYTEYVNKEGYVVELCFVLAGEFTEDQDEMISDIKRKYQLNNNSIEFNTYTIMNVLSYFGDITTPRCSLKIKKSEYFQDNDESRMVATVLASDLIEAIKKIKNSVFSLNPRSDLGGSKEISKSMQKTIKEEANMFWHYNNGISAVCSDFKVRESDTLITNLKIVNGHQTISSLERQYGLSNDVEVLFRLSKVDNTDQRKNISKYTNQQNRITLSDLNVEEPEIKSLTKRFDVNWNDYLFENKRGRYNELKSNLKKKYKPKALYVIERDKSIKPRMSFGLQLPMKAFDTSPINITKSDPMFKKIFEPNPAQFILPHIFQYMIGQIRSTIKKDVNNVEKLHESLNIDEDKLINDKILLKILDAKISHNYMLAIIGKIIRNLESKGKLRQEDIINGIKIEAKRDELKKMVKKYIIEQFPRWFALVADIDDTNDFYDKATPTGIKVKFKEANKTEKKETSEKLFDKIWEIREGITRANPDTPDGFAEELIKLFGLSNSNN